MIYLSSSTRQFFEEDSDLFGCMFNITRRVGRQAEGLAAGCWWMLENANFTNNWTLPQWLLELRHHRRYVDTCLGIPIPDRVGDWRETLTLFWRYACIPRDLGYPVAFVTQDGQLVDDVPWDEIDTLFIGGSNEHKRGYEAERLALAALERGKWLHVGRVNSGRAGALYFPWADSWDGTTFSHHPTQQVQSLLGAIHRIHKHPIYQGKLEGI